MHLPQILSVLALAIIAVFVAGLILYLVWGLYRTIRATRGIGRYRRSLPPEMRERFHDALAAWSAGEDVCAPVLDPVREILPNPHRKIRIAGWVLWFGAGLSLVLAVFFPISLLARPREEGGGITGGGEKLLLLGVYFAIVCCVSFVAARRLRKGATSGRILGIVAGIMMLPGVVVLTFPGILILGLLLRAEMERVSLSDFFSPATQSLP